MGKTKKSPATVTCANCGNKVAANKAAHGKRFLSVENEWREQTLCGPCAQKLPPDQFHRSK